VNFFVIDKEGKHLYKNYALMNIVGDFNAKEVTAESWKNSLEIMKTQETKLFEESYKDQIFLSIKSPLIINDEVEGIIGLAIDVTDQKKLEMLERKKEVQNLAESVVHDIRTPLTVLSLLANHVSLPEKKHLALKNVITSIETILEELLAKYRGTEELQGDIDQDICVQAAVTETLRLMRYQYADSNVKFDYIPDANSSKQSVFIKGNYSDFCRMLSNLLNNAVESLDKSASGLVKIGIKWNDNDSVSIFVQDNGCGMPPEMVDKFMNKRDVQTTKENGHGLGMKQVIRTVDNMQGNLLVSSTENVGTEFLLTFPRSPIPEWFSDTIRVKKGNTVIMLDDDRLIFDVWRDVFTGSNLAVKYFTSGRDVVDFISSVEDKSRLFLIADYELRGQGLNGIDVIKLSGMQAHSLVVTNARISEVKPFTEDKLKIFPKSLGLDKLKVIVE
ncbi:MAG: GHKL domain-containing protein, partial [Alphaproteobacteria bacterium]|nr:GHKL domain-containing protein [Alphaproteobacteria bacterium]